MLQDATEALEWTLPLSLRASGADIIGVSANLAASGSDVQIAVEKLGRKFYPYQADFTNRDSLYIFLNKVKEEHPKIDILINNAGIFYANLQLNTLMNIGIRLLIST